MTLDQYMTTHGLTDVAFAAKVGVASTTVMRWRKSEVFPDWRTLPAIVSATGGDVTPNDFLPASPSLGSKCSSRAGDASTPLAAKEAAAEGAFLAGDAA